MSQRLRQAQKQPPKARESGREPVQQRKSLQDHCRDLAADLAEARRAKIAAAKRAEDQVLEDEQMVLMYGPNWRDKELEGDEEEPQRIAS